MTNYLRYTDVRRRKATVQLAAGRANALPTMPMTARPGEQRS